MISRFEDGLTIDARPDTTDWNTVNACVTHDEYGLADVLKPDVLVFDIGAHVGGVAVWAALKGANVVAVEPLPGNVSALHTNARLSGVSLTVLRRALAPEPGRTDVGYGITEHRYIGNANDTQNGVVNVKNVTLSYLVETYGNPDVLKLDCEGGEWYALADPYVQRIPLIVGEWHPVQGHTLGDVLDALLPTHRVTTSGPFAGPGGFRAEGRWLTDG